MPRTKKDIMRDTNDLRPTVHVGKDGITEGLVSEIKLQLKSNKVVKVRLLPSAGEDKRSIAEQLASEAGALLVDARGSVVTLCERKYFAGH
ncbi:MAG: YhbY family RNA-binding protein [Methanomassiliicoccales archaeon]|nr:MAG: YhbY family RNA-binding protein [Methanomassiliicoccales archaeon]